jgi:hypothetical protein
MQVFRIYLEPVVEYEGEPPFFLDVALDPDGNAVAQQPIFGVCGDFSRTTAFWPFVWCPETGASISAICSTANRANAMPQPIFQKKKIELGRTV